jgi:hypothetical protein
VGKEWERPTNSFLILIVFNNPLGKSVKIVTLSQLWEKHINNFDIPLDLLAASPRIGLPFHE